MINIDLQKNIVNITPPKNSKEYAYLESEVLMVLGSFLCAKEKLENKSINEHQIISLIQSAKMFFSSSQKAHQ